MTCMSLMSDALSCVVDAKASASVGLGSKSSRQLDANHAWMSHPQYIFSWLVAKARKGKVLVQSAGTVVLRPGRKRGCLR